MDSFRFLINDALLSKIDEPLIILSITALTIIALSAVFIGIELKKSGGEDKDAK